MAKKVTHTKNLNKQHRWPLNNTGLNCKAPLIHRWFSVANTPVPHHPQWVESVDVNCWYRRPMLLICRFSTVQGLGTLTPLLFKGLVYKHAKPVALNRPKKGHLFIVLKREGRMLPCPAAAGMWPLDDSVFLLLRRCLWTALRSSAGIDSGVMNNF